MSWTGNSMSTLPPAVQTFYNRNLLERAVPDLVYQKLGQKATMPKNSGNIIKWRRYEALGAGSTLTEGVTPSVGAVEYTDVTAELVFYGALCGVSDVVETTNEDPVITAITDVLGEQMSLTVDTVIRNYLVAGTNVFYANGVAGRGSVITKIAAADLEKIHRALRRHNAKYFKKQISASQNIGTSAVRPAFIAVIHPDTFYDLDNSVTGFKSSADYPSSNGVDPEEIGAYKNFRFIMSTNAPIVADAGAAVSTSGLKSTTGANIDIYQTLIFGMDAFGVVPFTPLTQEVIVHPPGSGDDYLKQRSLVGWKWAGTAAILNDAFMCRYEHGATA